MKIVRLLRSLYITESQSATRVNGELTRVVYTPQAAYAKGAQSLPSFQPILLEMAMLYATHDTTIGAQIQSQVISNLRFTDDIILIAENTNDLQTMHCQPSVPKYLKPGAED